MAITIKVIAFFFEIKYKSEKSDLKGVETVI